MTASQKRLGKVTCSFQQFAAFITFSAFILLAAGPCQGSGSPQMTVTLVGSDKSNMFFAVINASVDLPLQLPKRAPSAGLVISNGMFSIDINANIDALPSEEILPSGTSSWSLDFNQALAVYAELTGRELEVDENVRQFAGGIRVPQHPEMTRGQACEFFEATLLEQAGLEITKTDNNHAIVRFRAKSQE